MPSSFWLCASQSQSSRQIVYRDSWLNSPSISQGLLRTLVRAVEDDPALDILTGDMVEGEVKMSVKHGWKNFQGNGKTAKIWL
jgi:hypothetical protein